MSRYGQILAQVIDAERFPTLCGMLAAGAFDQPDDDPEVEFNFGLQRVLDGVALLVQERTPRKRSHSLVAFRHSSDGPNEADGTGGSAPVDRVDTGMAGIPVQRRQMKTPAGVYPCTHG